MKPSIAVPAIALLVLRAISNKSLTPLGVFAALLTAIAHAIHPWSIFFALLSTFFLTGTAVTKVSICYYENATIADFSWIKHDVKSRLTLSSSGSSGGEGARTHIQVLANSAVASVLILLHYYKTQIREASSTCWPYGIDLLTVGIVW
jgi:uncharacterized membrane protein